MLITGLFIFLFLFKTFNPNYLKSTDPQNSEARLMSVIPSAITGT